MPKIPDGAKKPADHQSETIKPRKHADGWELLRLPIEVDVWDETDLVATFASIKQRGDSLSMNEANIRAIGKTAKVLQEQIAIDSNAFKTWLKEGDFALKAKRVFELAAEYVAALGEASSS